MGALEAFLLGQEPSLTRVEVAERAGVPLDLAVLLWHQLGFPHHADDDVAFAESDVEALRLTVDLVEMGILPRDSQAALVRTWGRSYRPPGRVADDAARRCSRSRTATPPARSPTWPATCCPASRRCRPTSGAATSPAPPSTCSTTPPC